LLPAGLDHSRLRDRVDVVRERERHDVGVEAFDDRPRLRARAAVRLLDADRLARLRFPVTGKRSIELLIELTRGVVRGIE
jgi:hypothetical protein